MVDKVDYCGIAVARLTASELIDAIKRAIDQRTTLTATYLHLHTVNLISENPQVRDTFSRIDIVAPDGLAVLWSSRLFGASLRRENILVMEMVMSSLVPEAIRQGWSFFLFGAEPGVAPRAMENLAGAFPGVRVVGTHHGYVTSSDDMKTVVALITAASPTILLVGLGQPKQEEWILRYRDQLGVPYLVGVGGFLAKLARSASIYPAWVHRTRLYWVYRLLIERKTVWKRYTIGVPLFVWNVLRARFRG